MTCVVIKFEIRASHLVYFQPRRKTIHSTSLWLYICCRRARMFIVTEAAFLAYVSGLCPAGLNLVHYSSFRAVFLMAASTLQPCFIPCAHLLPGHGRLNLLHRCSELRFGSLTHCLAGPGFGRTSQISCWS